MDDGRPSRGPPGPPQPYHQPPPPPPPWPYWFPAPTPPPPVRDAKKKKDDDPWIVVDAQAAFLGPDLWGAPKDQDFKLQYADLEEFLNESEPASEPTARPAPPPPPPQQQPQPPPPPPGSCPPPAVLSLLHPLPVLPQQPQQQQLPAALDPSQPRDLSGAKAHMYNGRRHYGNGQECSVTADQLGPDVKVKVEFQVSPADLALATEPGVEFDPQTHQFSDEELKPQPMCKKSRKQVVPEERKDQKYWTRRQRNNTAAKRSRDARRLKENQIVLRANFLEKENAALREAMDELTRKNQELKARMACCRCR